MSEPEPVGPGLVPRIEEPETDGSETGVMSSEYCSLKFYPHPSFNVLTRHPANKYASYPKKVQLVLGLKLSYSVHVKYGPNSCQLTTVCSPHLAH